MRMTQAVSFVNNVTFSLLKTGDYNYTTTMMVGSRVHFQMQIAFPVGTTDLLVELFTPDNDTLVMMLCSPQITFVGPNIQYSNANATPALDTVPNTRYVSLTRVPRSLHSVVCSISGLYFCSSFYLEKSSLATSVNQSIT